MLDPGTLRGRLSLGYASALIVALAIFALLALTVVNRAQRSALDAQLEATAGAVRIIGDVKNDDLLVDASDHVQFLKIVGERAQSAIVARDGSILVSTDDRMAQTLVAQIGKPERTTLADVRAQGEGLRLYASPIVKDGKRLGLTLAWRDLDVVDDLDRRVALAFAIAIPLIAGVALLAGAAIARRGLAPLDRIATLASEIEAHDLSRRLRMPGRPDEVGTLAGIFDRMLDRLQSAFDRERRFTNDASHELRAPLSVIRAEADLALRHERSPDEYRRALETIAAEADALETLTRDLLAAARSGSEAEDVREAVDLATVADAVVSRMSAIAGTRHLRVRDRDATEPGAVIEGNRTLIERALVGVLHNALKYSAETGVVEIRVAHDAVRAELVVTDDGPGFSHTALERALERFWRDDDARASEGSGLGLSLAKTIVERYGGAIVLANAVPHGAVVSMSFPIASETV